MPSASASDSSSDASGDRRFVSHRAFAACWDWATRLESRVERQLRRAASAQVSGASA